MAALLAVMGAISGVVPATAPAATTTGLPDTADLCNALRLAVRIC